MLDRLPHLLNRIPPAMRPDLRIGGMVLAALIALTTLLLSVYIVNVRAERDVLSGDSAFVFSVTVPGSEAVTQAKTTESTRPAAREVLPEKPAETSATSIQSAYETYKVPAIAAPAGVPQITLILTGFGISTSQSRTAIEALPPGVTLGLSPYLGADMTAVLDAARAKGLEIWLDIPVRDATAMDDPGPYAIDPQATPDALAKHMQDVLQQGGGYAGILLPTAMGAQDGITPLLAERGLALAALPPPAQVTMTAEGIKEMISASVTSGARVITLPLNRLTVTVVRDMVAAQAIAVTPLSTLVKPTAKPEAKADNAPPETALTPVHE